MRRTFREFESEERAKPMDATIAPEMHTARQPNLFVNALTIGPKKNKKRGQ
jgi:hypothetical protein